MTLVEQERIHFHKQLLAGPLTSKDGVPSIADSSQAYSKAIAKAIVEQIGSAVAADKMAGQTAGHKFEEICAKYIKRMLDQLAHIRPGVWEVHNITSRTGSGIAEFEQYGHIKELHVLLEQHPEIKAHLGNDYLISPDIIVLRKPMTDVAINMFGNLVDNGFAKLTPLREVNNPRNILHASLSCKWTLRSDRAQNARSEALNLIRNRKGRVPHIVLITAEPTPSRLSSIALGTGDIDCVYHFALPELMNAVDASRNSEAIELLQIMLNGKRLRDISDLPFDLSI